MIVKYEITLEASCPRKTCQGIIGQKTLVQFGHRLSRQELFVIKSKTMEQMGHVYTCPVCKQVILPETKIITIRRVHGH